jgi:glyoxylase-like metal-dependent hydrolase (beta-lactamase superfamily II)
MDRHAWERPGAFEELPGVFRIPLPLPGDHLKAVNVYAVADGAQAVLVDAGWALTESRDLLERSLGEVGYSLGDIREFLVTHIHRDHYTQAIALRREFGSRVSLGEGERLSLDALRTVEVHPDIANLHTAGAFALSKMISEWRGERDLTNWEAPDRWLPDALDIELQTRTLRVISTPGHTRGHVVFHDLAAGALFAGDHVLPHITPSIGIELERPLSPLRDYLDSLTVVQALPDATLLPAHGPVAPSTHARARELLAHHDERLTQTLDAVRGGADTGFAVANELHWTRRQRHFDELDEFNQIMAVHETMAHLQVLVERGDLTRRVDDGVAYFTAAPTG